MNSLHPHRRSTAERGLAVVHTTGAAIAATAVFTGFWHWMAGRSSTGPGEVDASFHRLTEAMAERVTDISTTPLTALVITLIVAVGAAIAAARTWCTPAYGLWLTAATAAIATLVVGVQSVMVAPVLLGGHRNAGTDGLVMTDGVVMAVVGCAAVVGVAKWREHIGGPHDRPTGAGVDAPDGGVSS